MRRLFLSFCATVALGIAAFSQTPADYKKYEVYVGVQNTELDTGLNIRDESARGDMFKETRSYRGFNTSAVRNFNRYFGVKGEFSQTRYTSDSGSFSRQGNSFFYSLPTVVTKSRMNSFMGGIQVKDNSVKSRLKPVGYALIGARQIVSTSDGTTCDIYGPCQPISPSSFSGGETNFSTAFGGGLDVRLNNRLDFRAFKVDYNPSLKNSHVNHNVRFGAGLVF